IPYHWSSKRSITCQSRISATWWKCCATVRMSSSPSSSIRAAAKRRFFPARKCWRPRTKSSTTTACAARARRTCSLSGPRSPPGDMRAAYINQTGPPEVVIYGELPTPKPGRTQCLIKVAAVDMNPIDTYIRSGMIAAKLSFPCILGRDLAGTIVEIGPDVKTFKPGQRVWATNQGFAERPGTFCEFAAVDECWVHAIPNGVRDEEVVAASLVGITAHFGLVRHANLKAGE